MVIHRPATNLSPNIPLRQAKKMIVPEHIIHECHQAVASLYLRFHNTILNTLRRKMATLQIHAYTNKTLIDPTQGLTGMTGAISKTMAEVVRSRWLSPNPHRGKEPQLLADIAEEER